MRFEMSVLCEGFLCFLASPPEMLVCHKAVFLCAAGQNHRETYLLIKMEQEGRICLLREGRFRYSCHYVYTGILFIKITDLTENLVI